MRSGFGCSVTIALGLAWLAAPAGAEDFPMPRVEFSADVTMDLGGGSSGAPTAIKGRLYSAKEKERREMAVERQQSVILTDRGKKKAWVLMPQQRLYMVVSGQGKQEEDPSRLIREGDVKLTNLGSERVNGMATTKYKIVVTTKSHEPIEALAWLTSDYVPVRMESVTQGSARSFRVDHTNIKVGKQDPALFEVPAGYREMKMPFLPEMDVTPGEGSPGEGDRMRQQLENLMKQFQNK
jgi:hypothetical protein